MPPRMFLNDLVWIWRRVAKRSQLIPTPMASAPTAKPAYSLRSAGFLIDIEWATYDQYTYFFFHLENEPLQTGMDRSGVRIEASCLTCLDRDAVLGLRPASWTYPGRDAAVEGICATLAALRAWADRNLSRDLMIRAGTMRSGRMCSCYWASGQGYLAHHKSTAQIVAVDHFRNCGIKEMYGGWLPM